MEGIEKIRTLKIAKDELLLIEVKRFGDDEETNAALRYIDKELHRHGISRYFIYFEGDMKFSKIKQVEKDDNI